MVIKMRRTRDIGRLVLDLISDVDIKRVSPERVRELFGKNAVAGIRENGVNNTIYVGKGQSHADTVRCILHELSHYYSYKYENIPPDQHDEETIEHRASAWKKVLYSDDVK